VLARTGDDVAFDTIAPDARDLARMSAATAAAAAAASRLA